MAAHDPVLELRAALAPFEASSLPNAALDLRLMPGECVLIETLDPERAASFADLCSGMIALLQGEVLCMGMDWSTLPFERAAALRGRIGRTYQKGGWNNILPAHINIMLPQLHHTRTPAEKIATSALTIGSTLGLPGLPLVRPNQLSEGDLIRAGCVRAFLGAPRLLLLETSISSDHEGLIEPFLELLSQAMDQGTAAICFTRDVPLWKAHAFPTARILALLEDGLVPMRGV